MNIYDIAREAGVSISTVSRVLNDKGNVNENTRKNVMEILHKQSRRRTQMMPAANGDTGMLGTYPIEVAVGGATVFVLDVDQFQKL